MEQQAPTREPLSPALLRSPREEWWWWQQHFAAAAATFGVACSPTRFLYPGGVTAVGSGYYYNYCSTEATIDYSTNATPPASPLLTGWLAGSCGGGGSHYTTAASLRWREGTRAYFFDCAIVVIHTF